VTTLEAAILGLVQGVTEFLPISSTAHLRIVPAMAGWKDPGAAFTAVLQLGTLAAVIGFFLPDLLRMSRAGLLAVRDPARRDDPDARQLFYLIAGTIPVGVAGVLFKKSIEGPFRSLWVIATSLIVVGVALVWVEHTSRRHRGFESITLRDAVIIGCAQALALVPGVSRSGITLLAAMALGLQRDAAARFSFLLSVPAVAAAGVFELPDVIRAKGIGGGALMIGLAAAAISGYASIYWLLRFLRTRTTVPFVVYRVALALLIIGLLLTSRLPAR
jgi:undecaprenyl-diphosphatase